MNWWNRWRRGRFEGVNLVGYARGGLGLGETLRRFAQALHGQGLPFSVVDVDLHLGDRGRDERLNSWITRSNPYPVNLLMVTASELPAVRAHLGEAFFAGKRNVGYWFWELEQFPPAWHGAFNLVDEAWTATEFVAQALRPHTGSKVRVVPHPVDVPEYLVHADPALKRALRRALGLPESGTQFLFTFDFHSYLARKNPMAAVEAFERAFGRAGTCAADDVRLVIKSSNGHAAPSLKEALMARTGSNPRVLLMDRFLDYDDHMCLMASCDAYVSLHRSEGFGQGMAEAMLLGKPVIATAYSGNLDFMTHGNSALVQAGRVALGEQDYPHGAGQHWADPNLDDAAAHMRRVASDPRWARELGQRAHESVRRSNAPRHCALALRDAVAALAATG